MKIKKTVLAVAICCLGSLVATNVGWAALSQLNISYPSLSGYRFGMVVQATSKRVYAVPFAAGRVGGDSLPTGHPDPFITFCMDIDFKLANGYWKSGSFSDVSLTSDSGALRQGIPSLQYAAELYATYAGGIMPVSGNWALASTAQKNQGSALQLAIWEVLYEYPITGGFSLGTGTGFKVTSGDGSIISSANTMLASLTYGTPDPSLNTTFWNAAKADGSARSSQDLIGPFAPVPEPTTCVAGALLLLPFLASTVRVWRKSQS